jgi:chromosome segregation ATPase
MDNVRDLTVEILKSIRDEIRATREDLGARIDQTNARLDQTNARLEQVEESLGDVVTQQRVLARHVDVFLERESRVERELSVLRNRVDAIESRLGERGP